MFETSKDLLYVVLSLSILWFTVFLCWLIYQAARAVRNVNDIIENITNKLELITDAVEFIKKKMDHVSGHMGMMSGVVGSLVEKFVVGKISSKLEQRSEKKKTTRKKK